MLRDIDTPPLWLALALVAGWALGRVWPGPGLGWPGLGWPGLLVVVAGLVLMSLALLTMGRARTTFIPRRDPTALVTGGVFGLSRNPIYLADAMILTGALLYWGAWAGLPLVPLFMVLITRRFIRDEEARLHAGFAAAYEAWAARVPRWFWRI